MILDLPKTNERRKSPRHDVNLAVDIVQENGNILTVNTRNISSKGLQIVCDSWVANALEPRGIQSHNVSHLRFKIVAELSISDKTQKLYANCRIMSVHRLSQDEFILCISFIGYENGSKSVLDKYMKKHVNTNIIHKGVVSEFQ